MFIKMGSINCIGKGTVPKIPFAVAGNIRRCIRKIYAFKYLNPVGGYNKTRIRIRVTTGQE